jgi:DNA-binding NarL/FixJ family response regulator
VTRVLLVDDQALVRAGFRMILETQPDIDVVGEAANGREALALTRALAPELVLMDIRMPELDGIDATKRLVSEWPEVRVLMLTTFDLDEYVYRALRAGAAGFLLKNVPPEELIAAVRAIAAGDALLAPEITRKLIEHYVRSPQVVDAPRLHELSEREREVLHLIARGLSNTEIAAALFVTAGTVKTHVTRILGKLGLRDRVQAVVFAYENGLIKPGEAPTAEPR